MLFTLRELMSLEEQRILGEKSAEEAQRAEALRKKTEAEFRIAAETEAKRRAQEERRRADEAALREEQARLEAVRIATIERARLEAAAAAQQAEMAQRHQHEQALHRLRADGERHALRRGFVIVLTLTSFAAVGGAYLHFGVLQPRREAERARLEAVAQSERAEADRSRDAVTSLQREADDLAARLEAERKAKEAALARAAAAASASAKASGSTRIVTPPPLPTVREPEPCNPKDPMCGSLKHN